MEPKLRCAYCPEGATTVDHVVPRALYPESKAESRIQRITVDACRPCNKSWEDDEPHFRSMMLLCGGTTPAVRELWEGKTRRSFAQVDGRRRLRDLLTQMVPVQMPEADRHMVYPGRDDRVMRIVRKIVRGLCHHLQLLSPVLEAQVWADVQRFEVPPEFIDEMEYGHVEEDIFQYRYGVIDDAYFHSAWVLRFFCRASFLCIVYQSIAARAALDAAMAEGRAI
jgi:hypothetical protein